MADSTDQIGDPEILPGRQPGMDETIVHLAAEYWPYARTGGLAEAVRGIARFQAMAGRNVAVIMPLYTRVRDHATAMEPVGEPFRFDMGGRSEEGRLFEDVGRDEGPRVYFIDHPEYFDRDGIYGESGGSYPDNHRRFGFLNRAALKVLPRVATGPVILHAHDWHASLAAVYLGALMKEEDFFQDVATVLTVHNGGYQGHYEGPGVLSELGLPESLYQPDFMEWYGKTNLLKGGLVFSDMVTTVSPTHARELRTRTGGFGLQDTFNALSDRFVGILNGIDYEVWDPATDPDIEVNYTADDLSGRAVNKAWLQKAAGLAPAPDVPLIGMSARLVEQKGLDLILAGDMMPRLEAQWFFLGEGQPHYQEALGALARRYPDQVAVRFNFTEDREHKLMAGADLLLMPSLYEPCGLTQMRAQRYGALPVVRRVGGLADTVEDRVTGFVFDEYQAWALEESLGYAIDLFRDRSAWTWHVKEAMRRDFSWQRSVDLYANVYFRAVLHHLSLK